MENTEKEFIIKKIDLLESELKTIREFFDVKKQTIKEKLDEYFSGLKIDTFKNNNQFVNRFKQTIIIADRDEKKILLRDDVLIFFKNEKEFDYNDIIFYLNNYFYNKIITNFETVAIVNSISFVRNKYFI